MDASATAELTSRFQARFGRPPEALTRAPGRVELLGNHTDYNLGLIMALAVDKTVRLAAAPRADREVQFVSTAFPETAHFSLDRIEPDPAVPWADYAKGILRLLQERGARLGGFDLLLDSSIPLGGGLSSSAAMLVGTALTVRKLYPYRLTSDGVGTAPARGARGVLPPLDAAEKMILAHVCQAAENHFVGVKCGLLDYIVSLFGRAAQVVLIDCLNLSVDWTPLAADMAVVICHSGVKHALVAGEYNERRALCEAAAAALGVRALRFVNPADLEAGRAKLTDRQYGCALHVVGENDRVERGADLLRRGDLASFGELLRQSHESSRLHFLNSCPELDVLVELAWSHPACIGARLTGGGFGGATLNLVRPAAVEDFRRHMAEGYARRCQRPLESWACQVVNGAN
ncbi:MAG TPA: galactokinase family protein [Verrucomicrobiota bacterium]|nr:galactokinase family protein [Verrucomicrobiota bacterium]HNU52821.1 galactokinase family protein [Verrucomicrobiota bacterium]